MVSLRTRNHRKRYAPRLIQEVLHELKNSEVLFLDDDQNAADWLRPNAKQLLAREARLNARSARSDTQRLHRIKPTQ